MDDKERSLLLVIYLDRFEALTSATKVLGWSHVCSNGSTESLRLV